MKKILLITFVIFSQLAFGQGNSPQYNSTTKTTTQSTGVVPKAKVWSATDSMNTKSPIYKFETGRVKFKNLATSTDTATYNRVLVLSGDSLRQMSRSYFGGGGGSAAIDTTKVGRIEQGRGTAPIFMYFNGVAWVRNDTSYVAQTGNTKLTGNLKRLGSAFRVGLRSDYSYIDFGDYNTQIATLGGVSAANIQIGSGVTSSVSLNVGSGSVSFTVNSDSPARLNGQYYTNDLVYRTNDSLRCIQLKDAQERFAPIGSGAGSINSVYSANSDILVDSSITGKRKLTLNNSLTSGYIKIGDGTNTAFPRTLSGDVTISNTGVTSYNGVVPSSKGGAGAVNGILKANGSGVVSAATAGTDYVAVFSQYKVAYVDTLGDNATAIVGRIDRKFATIDAALIALPSSGGIVEIGVGTFQSPSSANLKSNIWLKGSQRPDFNWTVTPSTTGQTRTAPTKLIGGTILQNALINAVQNINVRITDLGVDVGSAWCTASNGGVAKDGIVFSRGNSVPNVTTPVTNVQIENVTVLGQSASSLFHDILFDNGYDIFVQNVRTCFNVHGIVIKGSVGNVNNVECFGHQYDGIIVKSNDYAYARAVNLSNIYIGSVGSYDGAGIHLQNGETGADAVFYGVNISNFFIDRTTRGITIQNEGVDNVNINNGTIWFPQTHGIYSPTGASFYNSIVSNVIVRGSAAVGLLINNAFNTTIADVVVTGSGTTGCDLSGNGKLVCSNLIETSSSGTGIAYGSNVYAYNVQSSSSTGVPTKINIEGSVGSSVGNTAIDLGGSSPYFNFRKSISMASYYNNAYKNTTAGSVVNPALLSFKGTANSDLNVYGAAISTQGAYTFLRSNATDLINVASIGVESYNTSANLEAAGIIFNTKTGATAATEKMRISDVGNVGIGTTVPTSKLHVSTNGQTLSSVFTPSSVVLPISYSSSKILLSRIIVSNDTSGRRGLHYIMKTRGSNTTPTSVANGELLGDYRIGGFDGTTLIDGAGMSGVVDNTVSTGVMPTAILFSTTTTNTLGERMRITSTGNVGIGTSSPTSTLNVSGSFALAYVAKTGTYTATANDYLVDCTSGTFTVTLPTAVGITGRVYEIVNSGAGTITVATTSSQTFVNVTATPTTLSLITALAKSVRVMSNGANWIQLN